MAAIALNSPDQIAAAPAANSEPFPQLDPGCISDAIPAFFIGRNKEGVWVARDAKGRIGGLFLFEAGALAFARTNSAPTGCATIYPSTTFELDLQDMGNPLVAPLLSLKRLAARAWERLTTLTGCLT
ncbi:MAG: hypothetical protein J0H42_09520 [Rhizobiales bacterium]|nr:hypothetical protein [Hyphomicrobiales bacterium]